MYHKNKRLFLISSHGLAMLAMALSILGAAVQASDKSHDTITVEADKAQINAQTNTIKYTGNVVISHPSVVITGESVELIYNDTENYFHAKGYPATVLWKHSQGTSNGSARVIIFRESANEQFLSMTGNAMVQHQDNQISGNLIYYDFLTRELKVDSKSPDSAQTTSTTKKDRVKIILRQKQ